MNLNLLSSTLMIACASATLGLAAAQSGELITNGDFELGDTSGWQQFLPAGATFNATTDANSGVFSGELLNPASAAGAVVVQRNKGIGAVKPGDNVVISFAAKGEGAVGGIVFVEFFSEIDGGGVSANELLGGGPLSFSSDWQNYCFSTSAGADVSGGLTLQIAAITGAAAGSFSNISIDDVSMRIPELAVNGDFELGDVSGWEYFPTAMSTFNVSADANTGTFGGELFNPSEGAAALVRQPLRGAGLINVGDTINVSFAAKGELGVGGVIFAEFFTELPGGGVTTSQLLGGGPIPITAEYQDFSFAVPITADASGGVTLQMVAVTGAVSGSFANLTFDDVAIETTAGRIMNFCTTSANTVGAGAIMSSSGSPSVSAQDFTIEASGMPANKFGLFVVGLESANMPSLNGTQCVGNPCRIGPIFLSSETGTASRLMTDDVYTQFGCTVPIVGSVMTYQTFYRDTVGTGGNWSDGLCVVFGL